MKPDKKVAIIIDDFGNGQGGTEEMLSLPIKLTVAIMPFLPTSKTDAELAHKQGHDVIVHMPMEPKQGNPKWLGPGAITSNMSNEEIRQRVEEAIDNVPYAVGMNNHMGSKITGDERIMSIVLEVCRERGLFFVDSKTNYHSVVGKLAVQMGMPPVANNIFLDDRHTVSHVSKQMKAVETWASEHQNCVTIGHVGVQGKKTAEAIRQSITVDSVRDGLRDLELPAPVAQHRPVCGIAEKSGLYDNRRIFDLVQQVKRASQPDASLRLVQRVKLLLNAVREQDAAPFVLVKHKRPVLRRIAAPIDVKTHDDQGRQLMA
ncbi:hypothetical protein BGX30_005922 [Mortierella sp. GBA39]|nr:hypothetical protein BGX30_005922 [Mortierella sp. GBA39]